VLTIAGLRAAGLSVIGKPTKVNRHSEPEYIAALQGLLDPTGKPRYIESNRSLTFDRFQTRALDVRQPYLPVVYLPHEKTELELHLLKDR
jgi:hypothetical protein